MASLSNIGLLFVPVGAALVNYLEFMSKYWQIILFASILTTITCLIICAAIFNFLEKDE